MQRAPEGSSGSCAKGRWWSRNARLSQEPSGSARVRPVRARGGHPPEAQRGAAKAIRERREVRDGNLGKVREVAPQNRVMFMPFSTALSPFCAFLRLSQEGSGCARHRAVCGCDRKHAVLSIFVGYTLGRHWNCTIPASRRKARCVYRLSPSGLRRGVRPVSRRRGRPQKCAKDPKVRVCAARKSLSHFPSADPRNATNSVERDRGGIWHFRSPGHPATSPL